LLNEHIANKITGYLDYFLLSHKGKGIDFDLNNYTLKLNVIIIYTTH